VGLYQGPSPIEAALDPPFRGSSYRRLYAFSWHGEREREVAWNPLQLCAVPGLSRPLSKGGSAVTHIARSNVANHPRSSPALEVLEFVEGHLETDISVEDLASVARLSRFICRAFRRATEQTHAVQCVGAAGQVSWLPFQSSQDRASIFARATRLILRKRPTALCARTSSLRPSPVAAQVHRNRIQPEPKED
jgi:hypothetical protein